MCDKQDVHYKDFKKYCKECGCLMTLNRKSEIETKKFCSKSCVGRDLSRKTQEKYSKGILKRSKGYKLKTPRKKKVYFCFHCCKQLAGKNSTDLCLSCYNSLVQPSKLRGRTKNRVIIECHFCGNEFSRKKSLAGISNKEFCSKTCFSNWKKTNPEENKETFVCCYCGKDYKQWTSYLKGDKNFCSRSCNALFYNDGDKCFFYKDGRTSFRKLLKGCKKYKNWRTQCFIRDGSKCTKCNSKNTKENPLHVHHLYPLSKIFDDFLKINNNLCPQKDKKQLLALAKNYKPFWDIENGQTLCLACHADLHDSLLPFLSNAESKQ